MARFCSNCGNPINENAAFCSKCGAPVARNENFNDFNNTNNGYYNNQPPIKNTHSSPKAAMVLGILGIVFAWLYALIGHILSIIGIVLGAREYSETRNPTGLILSIIGEICSIISSVLGVLLVSYVFSRI